MGIDTQFQTIVYEGPSGKIHSVLMNTYIKSRKALNAILNVESSPTLKFFYFPYAFPVLKDNFRVAVSAQAKAPCLVTLDGQDPAQVFLRHEAVKIYEHYKKIIFFFEGGLGDYLDQADVLIEVRKSYPDKKIKIVIPHRSRLQALEMFDGFDSFEFLGPGDPQLGQTVEISFSQISMLQGYAPSGKVGAYSAIAGISPVAKRAKVIIPLREREKAIKLVSFMYPLRKKIFIALHTISGNTNTKSISNDQLPGLLSLLLKNEDFIFLHFGGAGEEPLDHPAFISLQGSLNWVEVFATMSLCSACICIDSAILHIAQHLVLPTLSFWGPTDPFNILGDDQGVTPVLTTAPCRGCNSYICTDPYCMASFNLKELELKLKDLQKKAIRRDNGSLKGSRVDDLSLPPTEPHLL